MHNHNIHIGKHTHQFHSDDIKGERNTCRVIALTLTMMVIEIAAGNLSVILSIVTHYYFHTRPLFISGASRSAKAD